VRRRRSAGLAVATTVMAAVLLVLLGQVQSGGPANSIGARYCHADQLAARLGRGGVATGSVGMSVYLTNVSGSRCVLAGYPSLQMLTLAMRPIPTTTHHGPAMTVPPIRPRLVSLPAGGSATFYAGYSDATGYGTDQCPTASRVAVALPHDTTSIVIGWRLAPYGGSLQHVRCGMVSVSPIIAGIHAHPLLSPVAPLAEATGRYERVGSWWCVSDRCLS
jgi:hypothetical protein